MGHDATSWFCTGLRLMRYWLRRLLTSSNRVAEGTCTVEGTRKLSPAVILNAEIIGSNAPFSWFQKLLIYVYYMCINIFNQRIQNSIRSYVRLVGPARTSLPSHVDCEGGRAAVPPGLKFCVQRGCRCSHHHRSKTVLDDCRSFVNDAGHQLFARDDVINQTDRLPA